MSPSFRGNRTEDPLDARSTPRVGADFSVEIFSSEFAGSLPGRTRDLSIGGTCIATASPFDVKSVNRIAISLPGQETLILQVSGCWQREESSAELMLTGLSFDYMTESDLDAIWNFVLDSGKYLARFLSEHSEIHELGLEDAVGLSQMTRYRDIPARHTLYRQGTRKPGEDSIYMLLEGSVILQVRARDAVDIEIARLEPGQFFGGFPVLADVPHVDTAETATDVRLLEIDRHAFEYIRIAKPWLGYRLGSAMLRISAQRLSTLFERVRDRL